MKKAGRTEIDKNATLQSAEQPTAKSGTISHDRIINGEEHAIIFPCEGDVSDDSIDDIRNAFSSPRYAKGEAPSPISSLTIESSFTAKSKGGKKKKVWQLEPIPTMKYIPVPQQHKLR